MGEVRDKRVVVLGSIITAGQSGEGETSFVFRAGVGEETAMGKSSEEVC